MQIIDRGHGDALVLVPGIQGRWEYMGPAIDALSTSHRVITFPLCGERGSDRQFDAGRGLDNFVDQIDAVLDNRGLRRAVICGVSFGGLVALRFAARRPARTSALILVSAPGPAFQPAKRHRLYARAPVVFGLVFVAEIPGRVHDELAVALPDGRARRQFSWRQIRTFARAPISLSRMAARSMLMCESGARDDCAQVVAPTLVVTGERHLDRVVPVDGTSEYARLIPGARLVRIERTGHVGYISRPDAFVRIVSEFLGQKHAAA